MMILSIPNLGFPAGTAQPFGNPQEKLAATHQSEYDAETIIHPLPVTFAFVTFSGHDCARTNHQPGPMAEDFFFLPD